MTPCPHGFTPPKPGTAGVPSAGPPLSSLRGLWLLQRLLPSKPVLQSQVKKIAMANERGWEGHTWVISFPRAMWDLLSNKNALRCPPWSGEGCTHRSNPPAPGMLLSQCGSSGYSDLHPQSPSVLPQWQNTSSQGRTPPAPCGVPCGSRRLPQAGCPTSQEPTVQSPGGQDRALLPAKAL